MDQAVVTVGEELKQDLTYAIRALVRAKGFASIGVSTLAFGLAAVAIMFALVDCILLRPLPYPQADRLFVVRTQIRELEAQYASTPVNASLVAAWQEQCRECEAIAVVRPSPVTLATAAAPERLDALQVTPNMFEVLDWPMRAGRRLDATDVRSPVSGTVVVSEAFASAHFTTPSAAIGQSLSLEGRPHTIVGVVAARALIPTGNQLGALVALPPRADVLLPLVLGPNDINAPGGFDLGVLVRGRTSVGGSLNAELDRITTGLPAARRGSLTINTSSTSLADTVVGAERGALAVELGAVALLVVLICVNLGCLFLTRADERQRELAVRQALGAGRVRLSRLAALEALLVTSAGAVGGIGLARIGLPLLVQSAPSSIPRLQEVQLDWRITLAVVLVAAVLGTATAVLPGWVAFATDPADALRSGGRGLTTSHTSRVWRRCLLSAQGALCAGLLVLTALFSLSYARLLAVPAGFDSAGMTIVDVAAPASADSPLRRARVFASVADRLRELPGVTATGVTSRLPLDGESDVNAIARVHEQQTGDAQRLANLRFVTPDYFNSIGMPLVHGTTLLAQEPGSRSVVVSRRVAQQLFASEDVIGREMLVGDEREPSRIVGVVADSRTSSLDEPEVPMIYRPLADGVRDVVSVVLRSGSGTAPTRAQIQASLHETAPTMPIIRVRQGWDLVSATLARRRFELVLIVLFATASLLAAAVGTYGVMSHSLSRRKVELGIRRALGADRGTLYSLVLRQELTPYAIGVGVGVVGAGAIAALAQPLLFRVRAFDPLAVGSVLLVMTVVGVVACLLPTRRVVNLTGLNALRVE
ncbi:MAG: FtsX-like permease family protein [Gemmatimonas sp.]|nr:FtsX-like permease family protein [Gemmatimonas sp.]